ncbi:pirin-like C-terminal cupin domain-containing protein [Acrocarpospora macrocephala]|uniref:pirin-like C-terminal cupin domain-containing protein n=1 Tax=Acrocarpospora macrocephala TaxID=150177 RepID=UPI003CD0A076
MRPPPLRPSRLLLLGGEPLEEEIVKWWSFVSHSHEEHRRVPRERGKRAEASARVFRSRISSLSAIARGRLPGGREQSDDRTPSEPGH